jgi:hypothetical protein
VSVADAEWLLEVQSIFQRCRMSEEDAEFPLKVQYLSIYPFLTCPLSSFSPHKVRNFNKLFHETYGKRKVRILKEK